MLGEGPLAEQWSQLAYVGCRKAGLEIRMPPHFGGWSRDRVSCGEVRGSHPLRRIYGMISIQLSGTKCEVIG